jgi:hypothetical protein
MLGSMTPELQKQFEFYNSYDMIRELKSMYEKQAGVELFDLIEPLHDCKHESGNWKGSTMRILCLLLLVWS